MGKHDEAGIRRQIETVVERVTAKDVEGLKQLYAPDVVSFDIEPPLRHVGTAAKLAAWTRVFEFFDRLAYEVRDLTLVVGDDVAFGYGYARTSGTLRNGTATDGMWVRITYCFQRIDGDWLITHDHVSVPLDIASGKGVVDLQP
ncbi:nuclear transport factor 2 family protein [Micromonospora sp. NPDC023737]|uniref:YybH family protein n=1 Tax=unclassified Micromonospora TaxID=2617518 RepID=UPI0033D10027